MRRVAPKKSIRLQTFGNPNHKDSRIVKQYAQFEKSFYFQDQSGVNQVNLVQFDTSRRVNLTNVCSPFVSIITSSNVNDQIPSAYSRIINMHKLYSMARVLTSKVKCHFKLPTSLTTADSLIVGLVLTRVDPFTTTFPVITWQTLQASKDIVYKRIHKRDGAMIGHATVEMNIATHKCQDSIRYEDGWVLDLEQLNDIDTRPRDDIIAVMQSSVPTEDRVYVTPFVVAESTQITSATNRTWAVDYTMRVTADIQYKKPRSTLFSISQSSRIYPGHKHGNELPTDYNNVAEQAIQEDEIFARLVDVDTKIAQEDMIDDLELTTAIQNLENQIQLGDGAIQSDLNNTKSQLSAHEALQGKDAH